MNLNRKWLWIGGAVAGAAAALAFSVPLATLLIVAAVLACPAMMFFGMRGMHQGAGTHRGSDGMACCPPGMQPSDKEQAAAKDGSVETGSRTEPARRG